MAAPFLSTPFQPYVYQNQQSTATAFQILGGDSQIVQIMLRPGEKITARPGSACYMSGSVKMENVYVGENDGGLWQWLFGRSVSSVILLNQESDGYVAIAAPSPSRVLPIDLSNFDGELLCQPDAFLCSVNDVTVSSSIDPRARNIEIGAEVILKQKLKGQGLAFLVGGGSVVQKILEVGETLIVDAPSIVAATSTISFQLKNSSPMRRAFGGDNNLLATLTGPGVVFIQSLPFHRLSQRIARSVASPSLRDNSKFVIQIAIFFFLAYVMIVSSIILTDV
ncbi:Tryptophan RNA-binding attenuator protein-like protein [Rhynchospora pubera]|uniref:Tryptophan RNA-binding attenuator protein-like protein n=1 Tax=Rhynchospora pubera TaxID=906938 RepID=A0AAV8DAW3_9POAL|nr:Tryptophan RNA-binding attenuator protein-like protein [Rhynchospora pubera]